MRAPGTPVVHGRICRSHSSPYWAHVPAASGDVSPAWLPDFSRAATPPCCPTDLRPRTFADLTELSSTPPPPLAEAAPHRAAAPARGRPDPAPDPDLRSRRRGRALARRRRLGLSRGAALQSERRRVGPGTGMLAPPEPPGGARKECRGRMVAETMSFLSLEVRHIPSLNRDVCCIVAFACSRQHSPHPLPVN